MPASCRLNIIPDSWGPFNISSLVKIFYEKYCDFVILPQTKTQFGSNCELAVNIIVLTCRNLLLACQSAISK